MSEHRRTFTLAEKKELITRINADIAHGMLIQDACKKHSVGKSQYADWKEGKAMQVARHPRGGTTSTIDVSTLPAKPVKRKGKARGSYKIPGRRAAIVAKIDALIGNGTRVRDACRQAGIADPTYYQWKQQLVPVNGHKLAKGEIRVMLQVAAITFQGEPLNLSLEDAVKLQQGLSTLLKAHHG